MAHSTCPMLSHAKLNSLLVKQRTVTGGQAVQRKRCVTFCPVSKVSLVRPVAVEKSTHKPLLLYLPGTDGTGNSIIPQLPGLVGAGFDIRSLYITMDDRSSWDSLISQIVPLVRQLAQSDGQQQKLTIVAESFGGCLAFRLALAVPELIANMVVVNSATCFNKSYSGIINLIAASNLLSLFPEQLYQMAQAVLVPLLVCKEKVGPSSLRAIRSMMVMQPPPSFTVEQGQLGIEEPPAGAADQSRQSRDLYVPSATASWRMNMLTQGNLPDDSFRQIKTRVLLVGSGEDRLLPSLTEQTRLQRLLPNAQRLVLPESGHTALLEVSPASFTLADVDLVSIMARTGFLPSDAHHQKGSANVISQGGSQVGQSAAPQAASNGNGAAAAAASMSATDTVEGWVSDNMSNFLADPESGSDLPGLSAHKAPS
ncbi:MAG: alpha beta hydrolase [Trebouxia sp. A1-2]|nr:MAG: alpha beta hydrolase [Trebouxia sp. A1-2]